MKRLIPLLVLILLSACSPPAPALVPVETLVAQTWEARPRTATFTPLPTLTNTPTPTSTPLGLLPISPFSAPGAQCIPNNERVQGRVTRVIDGDTIEVAVNNALYSVRYIGIDAPEATNQIEYLGPQATARNKELVLGQVVVLIQDVSNTDQFGRLLRYVVMGETFINYQLVKDGYANPATFPPDVACVDAFLQAENEARSANIGLYGPTPIPSATLTPTPTITPLVSPTSTADSLCNCTDKRLTCKDFDYQGDAQACYRFCRDHGYGEIFDDDDGDGQVCEGRPRK